ncbi:hypothetical protein FHS19_003507 [Paenibacillus rhizosphaerae]|uniref:Uncharacterized protein n=1 Tax=Paenibacillus rhizosphaerae TaxID=297318 RepID=A0A839TQ29_9BACL|nr:hypothetical protein [Paenibacillus rhizosphaerae]MBB3128832.1 hypothetical protein [Paenibacillus rhizosphaerae]
MPENPYLVMNDGFFENGMTYWNNWGGDVFVWKNDASSDFYADDIQIVRQ